MLSKRGLTGGAANPNQHSNAAPEATPHQFKAPLDAPPINSKAQSAKQNVDQKTQEKAADIDMNLSTLVNIDEDELHYDVSPTKGGLDVTYRESFVAGQSSREQMAEEERVRDCFIYPESERLFAAVASNLTGPAWLTPGNADTEEDDLYTRILLAGKEALEVEMSDDELDM